MPPTKTSSATAPPPHRPVTTTAPRPVHRLPKSKSKSTGIPPPPESIPAPARAGQYAPQYSGYPNGPAAPSIRAPSLRPPYQPGVPAPAPDRPTDVQGLMPAQAAMSQQGQQQWMCSALPALPPPHSHGPLQLGPPALVISGGEGLGVNFEFENPVAVEDGGMGGRAGELGNGDANGNGIGEEEDEETEFKLPWDALAPSASLEAHQHQRIDYTIELPLSHSHSFHCIVQPTPRAGSSASRATHPPASSISLRSSRFAGGSGGEVGLDAMPGFVWRLYDACPLTCGSTHRGGVTFFEDAGHKAQDVGGVYALCETRDVSFVGCTILPGRARSWCALAGDAGVLYETNGTLSSLHDECVRYIFVLSPRYARATSSHTARTPSTENRMLSFALLHRWTSWFSDVLCRPLSAVRDGDGQRWDHDWLSIAASRWWFSAIAVSNWIATCGLANGLRSGFLALGLGIGRDRTGWEEDVSTEGGTHLWSSVFQIYHTGMCLATLVPETWMYRRKRGTAVRMRWGAGAGAVPRVGV
ncbi:hypothetical protein B0H13DRAFT_1903771 [Mycena leptocephala]|nr:hypothetical protein B0H13DRAFT_1903771 [Mycena leptocephala]